MQAANESAPRPAGSAHGHRAIAWIALSLVWMALLAIHREPVSLVVHSWESMPSQEHGYLVLVVVAFLAWMKRAAVRSAPVAPSISGFLVLLLAGGAAFVGEVVSAALLTQLSIIVMLMAALWAVMGDRVFRVLMGPLAFLFFAVPIGHSIIPTLMDWTANATVWGLRASGVPVLQQDRQFIIPSGRWSVVEACSGIRYLITSVFIGTLFAYLMYTRWYKRILFIGWMFLLPLAANWLRAYTIVMAAHLTDNRWGFGMSHMAFGWIIFGFAIFASILLGKRWADEPASQEFAPADQRASLPSVGAAAAAAVLIIVGWQQWANAIEMLPPRLAPRVDFTRSLGDLEATVSHAPSIEPRFSGAVALHQKTYLYRGGEIGVTIAYYRNQTQGAELIHIGNKLEPTQTWEWRRSGMVDLGLADSPPMRTEHYGKGATSSIAYVVYWVAGFTTTSDTASKGLQVLARLLGRGDDAAALVVTASDQDGGAAAEARAENFLRERLPRLLADLELASKSPN